jgi:hypothetical protein
LTKKRDDNAATRSGAPEVKCRVIIDADGSSRMFFPPVPEDQMGHFVVPYADAQEEARCEARRSFVESALWLGLDHMPELRGPSH